MRLGTKYGFTLSFKKTFDKIVQQSNARARNVLSKKIAKVISTFIDYYTIYRPVPIGSGMVGIPAKYATGTYARNLEIYLDGVNFEERMNDLSSGRYIPLSIVVRNHTYSKIGKRYSDNVEYDGWAHKAPYSPIRKAIEKARGNFKLSFSTDTYGTKEVDVPSLKLQQLKRKKPAKSKNWGKPK